LRLLKTVQNCCGDASEYRLTALPIQLAQVVPRLGERGGSCRRCISSAQIDCHASSHWGMSRRRSSRSSRAQSVGGVTISRSSRDESAGVPTSSGSGKSKGGEL